MAFDNSIYNVEKWVANQTYAQNDIVAIIENIEGTSSNKLCP